MRQKKHLKKLNKILCRVKECRNRTARLSDEALAHLTIEFRRRLKRGEASDERPDGPGAFTTDSVL